MSQSVDIEKIVREVVRRVRAAKVATLSNLPVTLERDSQVESTLGTKSLSDRVVTMAVIEGQLDGMRQVQVIPNAIITPAVIDELKARKIKLVRQATTTPRGKPANSNQRLVVINLISGFNFSAVAEQITQSVDVHHSTIADFVQSIPTIVDHLSQYRGQAVLLCTAPAAMAAIANRHQGVRAAVGSNFAAVRQAIDELGPNLLAIHPGRKSGPELAALINEFAQAGGHDCPSEFQHALS